MAVRQCPKCKEENKEHLMMCAVCGTNLSHSKLIGVKDTEKKQSYTFQSNTSFFSIMPYKITRIVYLLMISALFSFHINDSITDFSCKIGLKQKVVEQTYLQPTREDADRLVAEMNQLPDATHDDFSKAAAKYQKYEDKQVVKKNYLIYFLYLFGGWFVLTKADGWIRNYLYKRQMR